MERGRSAGAASRSGGGGGRGGSASKGRGKKPAEDPKPKVSTTKREEAECKQLEERIAAEMPEEGSMDAVAADFMELPLCRYTLTGLERGKFKTMTQIQRIAIPHALAGCVSVAACGRARSADAVVAAGSSAPAAMGVCAPWQRATWRGDAAVCAAAHSMCGA